MKCENCVACKSYFDGVEEQVYCEIGISEDEAYHDGDWYCSYNQKSINKKLNELDRRNTDILITQQGPLVQRLGQPAHTRQITGSNPAPAICKIMK